MPRLAAALACLLATSTAFACPQMRMTEQPLTPDGTTILDDGGVLVVSQPTFNGSPEDAGLHLMEGGADIDVSIDAIAPALGRIRAAAGTRTLALANVRGKTLRTYPQATGGTRLAAPRGTAVSTLTAAQIKATRAPYPPTGTMTITLAKDPPPDAFVLVVSLADGAGIAWAQVVPAQRTYSFSQGGKGCYPGPMVPKQRTRVTLAWIDVHGRISATSQPISLGAAPTPNPPTVRS